MPCYTHTHHYDCFWDWDTKSWSRYRPWRRHCYHLSCPVRCAAHHSWCCWKLGCHLDCGLCTLDTCCCTSHCWHSHCKADVLVAPLTATAAATVAATTTTMVPTPSWCHSACLAGMATIETGDEPDSLGKGTFKVVLDVHHFRPDELVLKTRNHDLILLHGKQKDERAGKYPACVTREFTRKYKLPRNYDATQATTTLSTDGMLTIVVPAPPPLDDVERVLDIKQTGVYYGSDTKALENP